MQLPMGTGGSWAASLQQDLADVTSGLVRDDLPPALAGDLAALENAAQSGDPAAAVELLRAVALGGLALQRAQSLQQASPTTAAGHIHELAGRHRLAAHLGTAQDPAAHSPELPADDPLLAHADPPNPRAKGPQR